MGLATVFWISSKTEPACWLVIFGISAYLIAKQGTGNNFLHGLLVGIANSVWVTGAHVLLFDRYIANHPQEAAMMKSMPFPDSPRVMMALVGPTIGVVSGAVIGLLALAAGRWVGARAHS